ncbi:MAG TPA: hypothetical protein VNM92_18075 [Thermoanaerobaculia bacterium]|nr:hypothetical protein [Thermoanaerobaculia bacterium]
MAFQRWFLAILFALPLTIEAQAVSSLPPAIIVTPERGVADFVYRPAVRDQIGGVIGSDGQNFLTVWQNGSPGQPGSLYVSRVGSGGQNLDGFGIPLSSRARAEYGLAGAWGNSRYLVVWPEDSGFLPRFLIATTIDREGNIGSSRIPLPGRSNPSSLTVAFDGTNFLVVWGVVESFVDDEQIVQGALISADGDLIRGPFAMTPPGKAVISARIAANRSGFRLFYTTRTELWTASVDSSGNARTPQLVQSRTDIPGHGPYVRFTVASDGSGWAIAHQIGFSQLDGMILRDDGTPSLFFNIESALSFNGSLTRNPRLVWTGGPSYLLMYHDGTNRHSVRSIGTNGPIGFKGLVPILELTGIVWSGSKTLVTFYEGRRFNEPQGTDLFAAFLPPESALSSLTPIVVSAPDQGASAVGWDGRNLLYVWEQYVREEAGWHPFAGRLDPAGKRLDGAGIRLSTKGDLFHPSVSFDGENFLVVWSERATLFGNRISPDGKVLDGKGFVISESSCGMTHSDIAWNGTTQMVVWTECRGGAAIEGGPNGHVFGSRINSSGQVIDTAPLQISFGPSGEQHPSITTIGSNFFVAWEEHGMRVCDREFCSQPTRIYGRRISESATYLDVAQTAIAVGRTEFPSERFPSLASNGSTIVVAWVSQEGKGARYARLDKDGRLLDVRAEDNNGRAISGGEQFFGPPSVAWNGVTFVVIYSGRGVLASRISAQGEQLDVRPIEVSSVGFEDPPPCAVAAGLAEVAVGYIRQTDDKVYGHLVNRLFSRRVREPLLRRRATRLK